MKKIAFYFTMLLILGITSCAPQPVTEPEKLKILLDVRDCTGQMRYGAKVVSSDGKYATTIENTTDVKQIELPVGANTFTFRVKDERGNTLSYKDTTFSVNADDRIMSLEINVKCDGFIKGRILDKTGTPKIGYTSFSGAAFATQDSNKTIFLLPIRYSAILPTSANFAVRTKSQNIGLDGSGLLVPNIPFGDTLDLGDVYGETVSNFTYTVNGDGFTNKIVKQTPTDVCYEHSGASTITNGEFWIQMIDSVGCSNNGINTIRFWLNSTPTTAGVYTLKGGELAFQGGGDIYTPNTDMQLRITNLGVRGRLIEGTFSGTASYEDAQHIIHTITITNGVFKVLHQW